MRWGCIVSPFIAHVPRYRGPSISKYTATNHITSQISGSFFIHKAFQVVKNDFLHILLAIQPVMAAYQHHINSTIQCPGVVSLCPFKPPTTTFCLHFTMRSSISIPSVLSPSRLFIVLLLAGDINPNRGPSKCLNITYANIKSNNNKYLSLQNLHPTVILISLPCRRPG